ncbi:hypothetical protein L596_012914 [Steinernema carpocapsae]|uniref:Secreted protein n=1 Tax=Steinernema carpocapsae TaxID=34508 RepID=A0A4U5NZE5_STECR|nr:hypothetical protein L596_012914 [Steinernema carpocapsae]
MFASRYLLLFCFFTALCTNAAKNANERACEMPSLAKTPGLQRSTQTFFTRLAHWRAEPSRAEPAGSASGSGEPAREPAGSAFGSGEPAREPAGSPFGSGEPACEPAGSARLANPARHPSLVKT